MSRGGFLPAGVDASALLEVGLRPATPPQDGTALVLSVEEVAAMLPAYEVERKIGQGGMGAVFAAVQRDLQRRVAIKVLSPVLAEQPGLSARFRHESRLMASLQHPGVVQVYEAGETAEGHLYYVMEFVDGEDLASRMQRGRLSVEDAAGLITQVADALHAAHALGIVHRDVKPANIFLSAQGPLRLGDFGLALTAEQAAEALRLTRAGTTVGTVEYAAPEQLSRAHPVSAASDVYSLGVLTYEMLTGELPRGNFDPPSLRNAAVDAAFDSVVLRALQTDPARRYADAGEFREAFLQAADRRRQQELRDEAVRRKMARRARMVAALAGVSLLTGGSAFMAWHASRETESARQEAVKKQSVAETAEQRMSGLLQFMLTDLRQRLEPTGNLGAMDSVLEKAVEHFRRKHAEAGESPETARELADVLVAKADVIGVRGLRQEAGALYTEALALAESARAAAPGDAARARRVIEALLDRTEHRMAAGDHAGALADGRLLLREAEAFAASHPGPAATRWQAVARRAIAHALGYTGGLEEAHDEYLRAQTLLRELAAAEPGSKVYAYEIAALEMALGSNAEARGDLPQMLRHFTAWNDYVVREEGTDSGSYSHSAFRMGVALVKLKRPAEAVPYLKDAVRIAGRDAAKLPGHKGSLNHVSWCVRLLAQAYEDMGHTAEAAPLRRREAEVNALLAAPPEK
jgi:serine/threonine protein kinase